MPITTNPLSPNQRPPAASLKLLQASGLQVPPASAAAAVPAPAEKVTLRGRSAELSEAAQAEISKLKARDNQVHQHEQAHLSAAAGLDVSGASFTYQRGPNGVNYAVAGEVKIDTSPGRTPEETLARAEMIRDAALAPADPSAVDRSVAAKAQNMAQQARAELMQQAHHADAPKKSGQHAVDQAYGSNAAAPKRIDTFV